MKDRGALYTGVLLIMLGGIFMAAQWGEVLLSPLGLRIGWRTVWPWLILFAGAAFLLPIGIWWEDRAKLAGLAIPGTIIITNGLILSYQNLTGNWRSWSYLWALEPVSVGVGLMLLYLLRNRPAGLLVAAAIVGGIGVIFFVIFASAFGGILRLLAPIALILMGLLIILGGLTRRPGPGLRD